MKLIVLDLDGTLLNSQGNINEILKQFLLTLQLQHKVIINTGRDLHGANKAIEQLKLKENKSYFIGFNGQYIHNFKNEQIFEFEKIKLSQALNLIQTAKKSLVLSNVFINDTRYIVCPKRLYIPANIWLFILKYRWISRQNDTYKQKIVTDIAPYLTNDIAKICFMSSSKLLNKFSMHTSNKYSQLDQFFVSSNWLEFVCKGISKGNALKKVCEAENILREDIICFGDGENDISMLKYANISVAMSNSNDKVKKAAKYCCESNDNNGIYLFLKNYFK